MRLIDADVLPTAEEKCDTEDGIRILERTNGMNIVIRQLLNAPTIDAVPVVRCRECENWEKDWEPNGFDPDNPRHFCSVNDMFPTGDWFCKDGQRREDGDG